MPIPRHLEQGVLSVKLLTVFVAFLVFTNIAYAAPLPSWNQTDARARIIDFVSSVTRQDSENYVAPADRIAVFDNDGTLWSEQPVYFQLIYAVDEVKRRAAADPSVASTSALQAAAKGDYATLAKGGEKAILEVINFSHADISVDDYQANVANWLENARHPDTGLAYHQMIYQPMVELLEYLRDAGFKTYIVSGGGLHFMRVFAEEAYGIPNEQVLGSYTNSAYVIIDGVPTIVKKPGLGFLDDKEGKPVNIDRVIGKRPIIAGGNSDGDYAMLEWTTAGEAARLGLLVHHTDAEREVAYDCDSHIGQLCKGLENGPELGWLIVDMAKDWARVYAGPR